MASNNDNPRRSRERPEDNPFIAFRRFADSQVSSLLNIVFTFPATIVNHNNVYQAREACLLRKGDKTQCDKLQGLEDQIAGVRDDALQLYRVGDLQQVLQKSEELIQLNRHADELRSRIVRQTDDGEDSTELVHRVANKKGQEWGWDWSWGYPKPFVEDRDAPYTISANGSLDRALAYLGRLETESKKLFGDGEWNDILRFALGAVESNSMLQDTMSGKEWHHVQDSCKNIRSYSPQALGSDRRMHQAGVDWREAYEDLLRTQDDEDKLKRHKIRCPATEFCRRPVSRTDEGIDDEPSYEYSHDHEDHHDEPPASKTKQDKTHKGWRTPTEEEGDRDVHGLWGRQALNSGHLGLREQAAHVSSHEQRQDGRCVDIRESRAASGNWCDSAENQRASGTIDIQKFLTEQVNGPYSNLRHPSGTESELDAYEQLLEKPRSADLTFVANTRSNSIDSRSSLLSTLVTTERTITPDGSVTTKVVLKKRFADGREESSETVHTQCAHDTDIRNGEHVNSVQASAPEIRKESSKKEKINSGWFWSS